MIKSIIKYFFNEKVNGYKDRAVNLVGEKIKPISYFLSIRSRITIYILFFIAIIIGYLLSFLPEAFFNYNSLGIKPRILDFNSVYGIFMSWTMHADFNHLKNNIIILLQIMFLFVLTENKILNKLSILIILSGIMVWIFGSPNSIHIGASGIVFALLGYMIASIFIKFNFVYLLALIFFGGEIYYILFHGLGLDLNMTNIQTISLSGHLGGFITGFITCYLFKKVIK